MFEIALIIVCVITLILLKIFLNVSFKEINKLKNRKSEKLEKLSSKFQKEEQICNDILKKLGNKEVKIKVEPEYNSCLYTIFNNTITIGKFKQKYMQPQTIAHECIHSSQNKKTLWFNFIFTNIYLIYYITVVILALFNKLSFTNIFTLILIFLGIIQYIIRLNLENEAMLKAKYIAKEYLEENKILSAEELKELMNEYDEINNIAIPFVNYNLISNNIIKDIILAFAILI